MAGVFDRINALRSLRDRLHQVMQRDDRTSLPFSPSDTFMLDDTIRSLMEREKALVTTRAALTVSLGFRDQRVSPDEEGDGVTGD